jgi:hypothetical protein
MLHKNICYRRHQTFRAKRKAEIILKRWGYSNITPALIGVGASTHSKACSCYMCGNPRKYFNELTIQERKHQEATYEEGHNLFCRRDAY